MDYIGSKMVPKEKRVYHREDCIYRYRINFYNEEYIDANLIDKWGGGKCSYCQGLQGDLRCKRRQIKELEEKKHLKTTYIAGLDTLYLQTEAGFWKVFYKPMLGYLLYHANEFDASGMVEQQIWKEFHRQCDVKATDDLLKIIKYVGDHDEAKQIIAKDYRKLPQQTKKQRSYFRKAKKKKELRDVQRVDELLAMIAAQKSEEKIATV